VTNDNRFRHVRSLNHLSNRLTLESPNLYIDSRACRYHLGALCHTRTTSAGDVMHAFDELVNVLAILNDYLRSMSHAYIKTCSANIIQCLAMPLSG
jgi:hypothetical protein